LSIAILTANWTSNVGGVTRAVSMLLKQIRGQVDDQIYLVAPGAQSSSPDKLDYIGIEVEGKKLPLATSTFRALKNIRPDISQVNDDFYMAIGAAIYRIVHPRSNRLVYTMRTLQDRTPRDPEKPLRRVLGLLVHVIRPLLHAAIIVACDRVVVLTKSMVDEMSFVERWACSGKTEVIPSGVTVTPASKLETEVFREKFKLEGRWPILCSVGVFYHPWKVRGHELLIETIAMIRDDYPEILLLIVGDGQHRGRLEALTRKHGVDRNVTITGYQPNAFAALASSHIYTHMALFEAQGVAIVEAMLAGKPIIAANRGGIPEVVPNGDSALLVEPDALSIERAIRQLLTDRSLANHIAEHAKERALALYVPEVTTKAYVALFEQLRTSFSRIA
jgi:glycosyltransferase involved in cell wall biosynthesis